MSVVIMNRESEKNITVQRGEETGLEVIELVSIVEEVKQMAQLIQCI